LQQKAKQFWFCIEILVLYGNWHKVFPHIQGIWCYGCEKQSNKAKKEMMAESSTVEYFDVRKPKPINQKFEEKSLADFQPPTHADPRLSRLPSSFWIIRHPNSTTYSTRFRISVETPTVRKGTTMGKNLCSSPM